MVALPSPTENKLLLKELKFSLLFFLIVKIPIGRGEGAAIDTPRGRDGCCAEFDGGSRAGRLRSVRSAGYRKGPKS